jgi:hypothetical protein
VCVHSISQIKNNVCVISISPAFTPFWLEKLVCSACGAESAVYRMREYKQHSLPPSLPRGGGEGRNAGIWGGQGGGRTSPISILQKKLTKLSPFPYITLHKSSITIYYFLEILSHLLSGMCLPIFTSLNFHFFPTE